MADSKNNKKKKPSAVNEAMLFNVLNNAVKEIPGVKSLADYKVFFNQNQITNHKSITRAISDSFKKKPIDIQIIGEKNLDLNLHLILFNFANAHSVMKSCYRRVMFEIQDKLNWKVASLTIHIEDIQERTWK